MSNLLRKSLIPAIAALFVAMNGSAFAAEANRKSLEEFLSQHCYECHDDLTTKGGLNLIDLPLTLSDHSHFELWERVYDRVRKGEMPPAEEPRPREGVKQEFLTDLKAPLLAADLADKEEKGRVHVRRLTRNEYEHSLHDLLHIDLPLKSLLPEEQVTHGFETVASGQQFSHFNLARYLEVADYALDEAFTRALRKPEAFSKNLEAKILGIAGAGRGNYRGPQLVENRVVFWPITLQFYGRMPATRVPESGWYRIQLQDVRALNAKNGVTWGTLRSGACASSAPILYPVGIVEATPKKRDLVFEAWIEEDHMLELKPNDATAKKAKTGASGGNVGYKNRNLQKDGYEGFEISGIKIERIFPHGTQQDVREALFGARGWEEVSAYHKSGVVPDEKLQKAIRDFASRAFRRPVSTEQTDPYFQLAWEAREKNGSSDAEALKAAYRAILCSPRFLTLIEKPGKLDDYELASRLSYMIWNSLPDPALIALAEEGKLHEPKILRAQLQRLLGDPKAERFVASFTDQWLNLKEIDFTVPDRRLYKTFDTIVQESMIGETRTFFGDLVSNDRSVRNLVQSEHSFLNERLSRFYGLKKSEELVPGGGLQRVSLEDPRRGGLVTQGAVLKVTADGTTTSPVIRGTWVAERILGMEIPPPPPGVPAVEPDIRGAVSIRDQLDKHRNSQDCAACHRNIDPGGFALENYDPVGLWRTKYGTVKNAAIVDPSGVTPDGDEFDGIRDWKEIYHEQPDVLAYNLAKQLLTYATGASVRFSDRDEVARIVDEAAKEEYGVRSLIEAVVASEIFHTK